VCAPSVVAICDGKEKEEKKGEKKKGEKGHDALSPNPSESDTTARLLK